MKYGVIGEKLSHSFSKEIHNRLFDYEYELREIPRGELDSFMRARDFSAINVTMPYKELVIPYLDEISDTARRIGAVNTIVNRDGRLFGYNTDFAGLKGLIERSKIELTDKKVLILGSGGTSKTAQCVAESLNALDIYRVSRTGNDGCITYDEAVRSHSDAGIIINTTPCGMYPNIGNSPIDISPFKRLSGVVDAIYNPLRSQLVINAQNRRKIAVGGLYMLVLQAVKASELFTGKEVSDEKTEDVFNEIYRSKQNIVLIGMPGVGKTTVGKKLASRMDTDFFDTDELIVKKAGKSIEQIFADSGEAYFRELESEVIREISPRQGCIIATGGGAVLRKSNVDLLKGNGRIYFIDRPVASLAVGGGRPLSMNYTDLKKRYNERYGIYTACCDLHIVTEGSADEIAERIEKDINK